MPSRNVFDASMFHRLRSDRPIRRPRGKRCWHGRGRIRNMVCIHERPTGPTPGRWPATEGDLVFAKRAHRRSPPSSTAPPATPWSSLIACEVDVLSAHLHVRCRRLAVVEVQRKIVRREHLAKRHRCRVRSVTRNELSTPRRASSRGTKRPKGSSPTPEISATRRPSRAVATATLAAVPLRNLPNDVTSSTPT